MLFSIFLGFVDGVALFPIYLGTIMLFLKFLKTNSSLILSNMVSILFCAIFMLGSHWLSGWPVKEDRSLAPYFVISFFIGSAIGKFMFKNKMKIR
jgi:hypothetical protein